MPYAPSAIVDALQASCRLHLTAIEHYTGLAAHLERWGYYALSARMLNEADDEHEHLRLVMDRLEYFDVAPALDHKLPAWPRHDYAGILDANLLLETAAAEVENTNIAVAREAGDEQTALVFVTLLAGSERSVLEGEAAKQIVKEIGLDSYLATFAD
jgi:bacterioferritin (cytochrome b1)